MKSLTSRSIRLASLTAALLALPLFASAREPAASAADPASLVLARQGEVPVKAARRDGFDLPIEVGNRKESVGFYLGKPNVILPDGSWLYREFTVDQGSAIGTLVVSFNYSHVAKLALISPAAEVALIKASQKPDSSKALVASNTSR